MIRFWAHQSTKAKEQRQAFDYYFNYAGQLPQQPVHGSDPGRASGLLAVPGQVAKRLVDLIRRILSSGQLWLVRPG